MTIRYLIPARTAERQRRGLYAPERVPAGLPDYPDRDYFLAVSEGSSGAAQGRGHPLREGGRRYTRGRPVELAGGLQVAHSPRSS